MAMTAWSAKFWTSSICLSVNGLTGVRHGDCADQLVAFSIGTFRSRAPLFRKRDAHVSLGIRAVLVIRDADHQPW